MPLTVTDLLLGAAVPAVTSLLVTTVAARFLSRGASLRLVCPLAVAGGFLAGYWLLRLGPIVPQIDRDWVPYAVLLAVLPAAIPLRGRRADLLRCALLGGVVLVAAAVLVPTWPSLNPSRAVYLTVWSIYTIAVACVMTVIARRQRTTESSSEDSVEIKAESVRPTRGGLPWLATMILALAAASAVLALSGSLRFAQTTTAGMAAFAGLLLGLWYQDRRPALDGVAIVYTLLICSALLTGKVNSFSSIPTISYMILPLAPIAYGLALPAGSKCRNWKRTLIAVAIATAVCGVGLGLAAAAESGTFAAGG